MEPGAAGKELFPENTEISPEVPRHCLIRIGHAGIEEKQGISAYRDTLVAKMEGPCATKQHDLVKIPSHIGRINLAAAQAVLNIHDIEMLCRFQLPGTTGIAAVKLVKGLRCE